MSTAPVAILEQRAIDLAMIFLTRDSRLEVMRESFQGRSPFSLDLHVEITGKGGSRLGRAFGVEVLAHARCGVAVKRLPGGSLRLATSLHRRLYETQRRLSAFPMPVIYLLFAMDNDRGFYGWLREPVEKGHPRELECSEVLYTQEIDSSTHRAVTDRILAWYSRQ